MKFAYGSCFRPLYLRNLLNQFPVLKPNEEPEYLHADIHILLSIHGSYSKKSAILLWGEERE
jgi:hypothetical protein